MKITHGDCDGRKPYFVVCEQGAPQPVHQHSLISAIVTHFLESIMVPFAAHNFNILDSLCS